MLSNKWLTRAFMYQRNVHLMTCCAFCVCVCMCVILGHHTSAACSLIQAVLVRPERCSRFRLTAMQNHVAVCRSRVRLRCVKNTRLHAHKTHLRMASDLVGFVLQPAGGLYSIETHNESQQLPACQSAFPSAITLEYCSH